jgi:hypothetical protein
MKAESCEYEVGCIGSDTNSHNVIAHPLRISHVTLPRTSSLWQSQTMTISNLPVRLVHIVTFKHEITWKQSRLNAWWVEMDRTQSNWVVRLESSHTSPKKTVLCYSYSRICVRRQVVLVFAQDLVGVCRMQTYVNKRRTDIWTSVSARQMELNSPTTVLFRDPHISRWTVILRG